MIDHSGVAVSVQRLCFYQHFRRTSLTDVSSERDRQDVQPGHAVIAESAIGIPAMRIFQAEP